MRLGIDIGTKSIGWWLYETDSTDADATITASIDGGVRIFSDGRDPRGTSLAVDRREARSARRRRDRYLRRRAELMAVLSKSGLMPADPAEAKALTLLDPYELRARGLDEPLPLSHLGRALFHLHQRRGFKSNRKTDRGDNESGKIKDATSRLDYELADTGARTYGEFLHMRRSQAADPRRVPTVRTRLYLAARGGPGAKAEEGYDFYPDRRHLEGEFHALWAAQTAHHPTTLTDELRDVVYEKIFRQRGLKQPEVGLCLFSGHHGVAKDERRLPKAHPLAQRRTLYETVNQLRITSDGREKQTLTKEQRDQIIHTLDNKKPTKSLASMSIKLTQLGKTLKLKDGERFTLETAVRDAIACDPVRASLSHPDRFGPSWSTLDWEAQWDVIQRIQQVESDADYEALLGWLSDHHNLTRARAEAVAAAPLPEGYGRLGLTATKAIFAKLEAAVVTYSKAVELCGWHHSDQRTGEVYDTLPYYGEVLERHVIPGTYNADHDEITRFGRITNPTVHIGLNQLRRVVNKIIEVYGKPDQIVVELARELKQSAEQKRQTIKRIKETTDDAKRRSKQLVELGKPDTGHNRMLLRLWEDLGPPLPTRSCPYTGKPISLTMLFDGSCDVDHILPYSRTLDDGFANRTLCLRQANRQKSNKTPWEVWGETDQWAKIEESIKNLPENKRWRFAPDAMTKFEASDGFLDRALVDTQYLARVARSYLDTLYGKGGHVWVVPGRMTEMLRRHWGLNSLLSDAGSGASKAKNRTDHRHHAIDAAVIAATDRSLLQKISQAAGRGEEAGDSAEQIARDTPEPWEGFRGVINEQLGSMIVSHRADHGRVGKGCGNTTTGRLHNDTAYGIVDKNEVVSRVRLSALKPTDVAITAKGKNIRDAQLQAALAQATAGKEGKEFETALAEFAQGDGPYQGIRRVRLIEQLHESKRVMVSTSDHDGPIKAYKADSNHCYELWRLPDGDIAPQVVTTYEANSGVEPRPHPAAKRILRVFKQDMVALDGDRQVYCVQQISIDNGLILTPHNEANADARHRDKNDPFKFSILGKGRIISSKLRRIRVDEIGRRRD